MSDCAYARAVREREICEFHASDGVAVAGGQAGERVGAGRRGSGKRVGGVLQW